MTGIATVEVTRPKSDLRAGIVGNEDMIELKVIPLEEAKATVRNYIKDHPGAWTSDVAYGLARSGPHHRSPERPEEGGQGRIEADSR